jgi:hypothetical protein
LIDAVYLGWVLNKINELRLLKYVWLYEFYMIFLSFATLLFYFKPGKIHWKGREYETA